MTILPEAREACPGVKPMHPENGDTITVFSGRTYLEHVKYLTEAAILFARNNIGWSETTARAILSRGLGVDRLTGGDELTEEVTNRIMKNPRLAREIPSTYLFRRENSSPGQYIGISVQRMFFIQTRHEGEVPVFYHVLRAIEQDHRGRKRGRLSVELGLHMHWGAWFYAHKSGNPIALHTNQKSESLIQQGRVPWDGSSEQGSLEREVHEKLFKIIRADESRQMEPTGVIRNDYPEPNTGFDPDLLYGGALQTYRFMTDKIKDGGLEMRPLDSLLALYRTK